jgi:hypothetical protein
MARLRLAGNRGGISVPDGEDKDVIMRKLAPPKTRQDVRDGCRGLMLRSPTIAFLGLLRASWHAPNCRRPSALCTRTALS